jgi:hypothetical protein
LNEHFSSGHGLPHSVAARPIFAGSQPPSALQPLIRKKATVLLVCGETEQRQRHWPLFSGRGRFGTADATPKPKSLRIIHEEDKP